MPRNLQNVINGLRGNDLPYGEQIVEALQLIENELDQTRTTVEEWGVME